jgi:hypothetical protein
MSIGLMQFIVVVVIIINNNKVKVKG